MWTSMKNEDYFHPHKLFPDLELLDMLHLDQTAQLQYVGEPEEPTIQTDW